MPINIELLQPRKLISWTSFVIFSVVFLSGWAFGHNRATAEIPQLAATDAHINRLEKGVFSAPACSAALLAESHKSNN